MESKILSVIKERDFYHAKVNELKESIRKLEYDMQNSLSLTRSSQQG